MPNTPNRNYPLPDVTASVAEEFYRLQEATLLLVDLDVHGLLQAMSGKAASAHGHSIVQIEGLQAALESKMSANRTFALGDLSDVVGVAEAPDGYIPIKLGDNVVFQSAAAAIGNHQHQIDDVVGLPEALDAIDDTLDDVTNALLRAVPTGASIAFNMATPPLGWLKENGAAVSRTAYAALYAVLGTRYGPGDGSTTFNLPDSRGEFVRGWDDGRGVDSARTLGSSQADANKSHTHTGTTASDGAHAHVGTTNNGGAHSHSYTYPTFAPSGSGGGASNGNIGSTGATTGGVGDHAHAFTTGSGGAHTHPFTTAANGEAEARPRNVSKLYCIKY